MEILGYILWAPVPEIFPNLDWGIVGNIRWYGLLFAMAFIVGQQIMSYIFKVEKRPDRDIETLLIYIVVGTIIGARLGHVFFYRRKLLTHCNFCKIKFLRHFLSLNFTVEPEH